MQRIIFYTALTLLVVLNTTTSAQVLFAPRTNYLAGDGPTSVSSADFDGDGDNDLAVANERSDNVSVFLNNGDGTFAPKVDYPAGSSPSSVFSADLDGDGDSDLAVANFDSDNMSVLLNNGDGTFAPKVDYIAGDAPRWIFGADLDGDLDNDLAVANEFSNSVSVLLNNSDGTFADSTRVDYSLGFNPTSVFSADIDGDGDNDLAVANDGSDNVSVLLNTCRHSLSQSPERIYLGRRYSFSSCRCRRGRDCAWNLLSPDEDQLRFRSNNGNKCSVGRNTDPGMGHR